VLLLAGTLPTTDIELHTGTATLCEDTLIIGDKSFPLNRGTASMIGAACAVINYFGDAFPQCTVAGDIGKRSGSRLIYRHLTKHLSEINVTVLGLHYIIPDIGLHNQVMMSIRKMPSKPCLIADAGFMYVAKASGQAPSYDIFLPDMGELAFLADDKALHPAYTRGFLTKLEDDPAKLIEHAYDTGNSARHLCVKGKTDYICAKGGIVEKIEDPLIEELEAIGGTGDTITGMVAGLIYHGFSISEACIIACRVNRRAGQIVNPTPATQITEIVANIPQAIEEIINTLIIKRKTLTKEGNTS
jgi:NAD(P)H-hydrate repair Nnr-like enzyme with NAD(P)H-hydrate dehydratase domain